MSPREEWALKTRRLGRRVLLYDRVESTNTLAAELALASDSGNDGVVILAREQTAGRGQHGRSWACPAGDGVLLSLLLFPPPELRRPALLTAWAAVSVCETIQQITGLQATIKWPNDVLLEGRKVCGILIEQRAVGGRPSRGSSLRDPRVLTRPAACPLPTVLGIGLNVHQSAETLAALGLPLAGSLALLATVTKSCPEIARSLIERLDREYDRLCAGDMGPLETRWQERLGLVGQQVVVECRGETLRGRVRHICWDGLELELSSARSQRIPPELIQHVVFE